ncbi:MAG: flagellar M-ring protein FliF [Deltaproteobacteria bacterium]|jgi:flagellar M-ring protein FliF|nr:flagellar M-ring protein FliF [Deltaproteobacteria bacterium]
MNSLLRFFEKGKAAFLGLPTPQKILYTGALLVFLGSLAFLIFNSNKTEYATLYAGLSQEDTGQVVEKLKAQKIPYQLEGNNRVSIPKDLVYETRLSLATEGLPKGAGMGFEIFDQQKLGSTEFVQKVNYQRALQGELARTINQIDAVAESRVHLVLPQESLFKEDEQPPSASVVLKLKSGTRLGPQQVQGIVNLVAGAVQGLQEDRITILSTDGQIIFKKSPSESSFGMSDQQIEYKKNLEEDLRRKVQTMLEQLLGANRVITRVSLNLDFNRTQVAEDTYDPDSAVVRSQQRSTENSQGKELGPGGNPDVPVNVESKLLQNSPQEDGRNPALKGFNRQRETVNYEINRVTRQITYTPGSIKRISVAVMVDGPYEMKENGEGKVGPVFVGRSPEEMKTLEDLVKKAAGYDEARGDQITVSNVPFAVDYTGQDLGMPENRWIKMVKENQRILLNLLLMILIFFFVVRPFMRKFQQLGKEPESLPDSVPALPVGQDAGAAEMLEPPEMKPLTLRQQAQALVQNDPERAAQILRSWLQEEV